MKHTLKLALICALTVPYGVGWLIQQFGNGIMRATDCTADLLDTALWRMGGRK